MKSFAKYMMPALLTVAMVGCKKSYLETNPSDQAPTSQVFTTTDGAYVALDGLYRLHWINSGTGHDMFGQKATDIVLDLMGTDMVVHSQGYGWFNGDYRYTSNLNPADNGRPDLEWTYYYRLINNDNFIINNIDNASGPQADKDNIKGQALADRAYNYFYLVNLFQQTYKGNENKPGVPVYTTPDLVGKSRGTVQDVYNQIIADLTQAETLLTGKVRRHISNINVNTVQGIRARVALQMEDYATAAVYAEKARQGYTLMSTAQYQQGFSKYSNPEWIWGMEVNTEQNTIYPSFFSHMDITNFGYAQLGTQKKITKALYDQIANGDVRKSVFQKPGTGTSISPDYNQLKFRVPTAGSWAADYLFMRVSEMYLIEAESLARTGDEAGAKTLLQALVDARNTGTAIYNGGTYDNYVAGLSGTSLVNEILLQRRIELWGEGFGLLDIKRLKIGLNRPTGAGNHGAPSLDAIIYTLPDQDPKFLEKIPQRELNANKSMTPADQNP